MIVINIFVNNNNKRSNKINKQDSILMFYYLGSLDFIGKYLISNRQWNFAINKYEKYTKISNSNNYKTISISIILQWKYFYLSNIAHCYYKNCQITNNQKLKYEMSIKSENYYKQSIDILKRLLTNIKSTQCKEYILNHCLSINSINEQLIHSNIELGHTFIELKRYNYDITHYKTAAKLSNKYQLIEKEFDAYFNLGLTLYNLKDYRNSLHIFQTKCRHCNQLCIEYFGNENNNIEHRINEFIELVVEVYSTNILSLFENDNHLYL